MARAGRTIRTGVDGLTQLFPDAASVARTDLEGLGLTRARTQTLRALARAVADQRIDFSAAPEEVVAALASVPGIGLWTAHYVALRALAEPDALPTGDLVLRRMAARGPVPVTARELEEQARRWQPWRGYAVMHLWRAAAERPARLTRGRRPAPRPAKTSQASHHVS